MEIEVDDLTVVESETIALFNPEFPLKKSIELEISY
jgi:hypothetical protein